METNSDVATGCVCTKDFENSEMGIFRSSALGEPETGNHVEEVTFGLGLEDSFTDMK